MNKRIPTLLLCASLTLSLLTGCDRSGDSSKSIKLNPDKPVSLTIWHYYNGAQQAAFEQLVSEFNASRGKELGIYVEGYSQGSVSDLEKAVNDAANGAVGAGELPDIISTYTDTAFSLQKKGLLTDLSAYVTEEELSAYVDDYIAEGYFAEDNALYLFPVAKSTEIFMMNVSDWIPFAEATGASINDLKTTEGITAIAKTYYEWTDSLTPEIPGDGKAFYGRDSMSNYFVIGMKQMGTEIFSVSDGKITLQPDKDKIRRLWDNWYVPIMQGWFAAYGRFRSDDVKTGDLLAYTGSSSSAAYFPSTIDDGTGTRDIEYMIMPAPIMENGENVYVLQGAGMAVTASEPTREYASIEFLKWFTQTENNLRFAAISSYLPVRKDANSVAKLDAVIAEQGLEISSKNYDCMCALMESFNLTRLYASDCFENGFAARKVLDYNLSDRAAADLAAVQTAMESGLSRAEAIAPYITDEAFDAWYTDFCAALNTAVGTDA